jgi:hypothetical protein
MERIAQLAILTTPPNCHMKILQVQRVRQILIQHGVNLITKEENSARNRQRNTRRNQTIFNGCGCPGIPYIKF